MQESITRQVKDMPAHTGREMMSEGINASPNRSRARVGRLARGFLILIQASVRPIGTPTLMGLHRYELRGGRPCSWKGYPRFLVIAMSQYISLCNANPRTWNPWLTTKSLTTGTMP